MLSTENRIDDQQKEMCAIITMRSMLEDYVAETGKDFSNVFFEFTSSHTYQMLFDYSTGLWREGPDYLKALFIESLSKSK